jgi:hypothetical protein
VSTIPPNLLAMIRDRVQAGHRAFWSHVIEHGIREGFRHVDVLVAIATGIVIEHYPERRRCLICARVRAANGRLLWLHVVCEYNDPMTIGIVTAYVPSSTEWEDPPVRRR